MAATLAPHVRDDRLNAMNGAPEVDVEQMVHVVQAAGRDRREQPDAGVVHQHVHTTELLNGAPHQRLHSQAVGHISRNNKTTPWIVDKLAGQGIQLVAAA